MELKFVDLDLCLEDEGRRGEFLLFRLLFLLDPSGLDLESVVGRRRELESEATTALEDEFDFVRFRSWVML